MTLDDMRLFEEKHVMHTLIFIGQHPGCMKTEIYDAISHNPRMPEKLEMLENAGLVMKTNDDKCIRYGLSPMGFHMAQLITEASEVFDHPDAPFQTH